MRVSGFCEHLRPTIIIPDVHETIFWKRFISLRRPGERIIFLGDYFSKNSSENRAENAVQNFLEICAYARENLDTHLLVGNHDFELMPFTLLPPEPWTSELEEKRQAIMKNIDLLNMVYIDGNAIFSHGGATQSFMRNNELKYPEDINHLWREAPAVFDWAERDPASNQPSDYFGDDPWQSPLWLRTYALLDGLSGYSQIIGHTPVRAPEIMHTSHGDKILLTCTLDDQLIRIGR